MGTSPLVDLSMKNKSLRYFVLSLLIFFGSLISGCVTDQSAGKEDKPPQETAREERARKEMEARALESSWYESSAYHRGKSDSGGIDVGEWLRTKKELEAKQEDTEKRLAKLESEVEGQQPVASQEQTAETQVKVAGPGLVAYGAGASESQQPLRFKVAMVVLPEVYGSAREIKETLFGVAVGQFAGNPTFILVDPEETENILLKQGLAVVPENKAENGRALGIYPAARLIVFVERLALSSKGSQIDGRLSYTLVDGFSGRTIEEEEEILSAAGDAVATEELLEKLVAEMVSDLEKRAARYVWSSRVAMVEGNRIYLSSGKASGLKKGDIFMVHGPGREIIHPTAKVSMGFQQGPYKGKVRVVSLFGQDAAEATVVETSGKIQPNDLITLPPEQK
jgi:hypothetical protein